MDEKQRALKAIQKKLVGKELSYKEIYAIMDEIAHDRLGDILTTYFAASGYAKGFSHDEIYFLTKAMIETGEKLKFEGIVADKHSIGGLPGSRCTMIIVPIIATAGFTIPKSSSRAITTPAGTADCMEVLASVTFDEEQIYEIVKKTNGCIVWGGSFNIAPADDEIIKVEEVLLFESYDKILISIMAKKIAFGSNHVVIDIPFGKTTKVKNLTDAKLLKSKFDRIAAYGSPAKATTALNYFGIDNSVIEYTIEDNNLKVGKIIPGVNIPIKNKDYCFENLPNVIIVLAWNFFEDIKRNNKELIDCGVIFMSIKELQNGTINI